MVLEPMGHFGFDKKEFAGADGAAFVAAEKFAAPADHYVNFIALMRCLQIDPAWRIKFHLQTGVFPEQHRSLFLFFR